MTSLAPCYPPGAIFTSFLLRRGCHASSKARSKPLSPSPFPLILSPLACSHSITPQTPQNPQNPRNPKTPQTPQNLKTHPNPRNRPSLGPPSRRYPATGPLLDFLPSRASTPQLPKKLFRSLSTHTMANERKRESNVEKATGIRNKVGPRQLVVRDVEGRQNTTCHVQIVGTGLDVGDTVPTVLLFFDQRRLIFNAGEGLQRVCIEHKVKLSKIDHIFLTRVCSETTGGLPGLLLTMAGIGDFGFAAHLWGHSDLQHLVDAMRTFVPGASVVHTHSFGSEENTSNGAHNKVSNSRVQLWSLPIVLLEEKLVKISAVILRPFNDELSDLEETSGSKLKFPRIEQSIDKGSLPKERLCSDSSVVYICELPEVKGKFDTQKAAACGIKPGRKYGLLQQGQSVNSDDGERVINPEDVLGPSSPGPIMIIVDCPTKSYIPSLTSARSLEEYFTKSGKIVNCMVHLAPASVIECGEYQEWTSKFETASHIMAGSQQQIMTSNAVLNASARMQSKLNFICPQIFPLSGYGSLEQKVKSCVPDQFIAAENLLKFRLRPLSCLGIDRADIQPALNSSSVVCQLLKEIPELDQARKDLSRLWRSGDLIREQRSCLFVEKTGGSDIAYVEEPYFEETRQVASRGVSESCLSTDNLPECLQFVGRDEMEIVFLGTCSSQPSKYRNVSAIYIHLFDRGGILLDCGEGTYGQLKKRFGPEGADEILVGLKCIWISHIHADHHTGLARILSIRNRLLRANFPSAEPERTLVVGPRQLRKFLDAYQRLEDLGMEFLDCSQTTFEASSVATLNKQPNMQDTKEEVDIRKRMYEGGLITSSSSKQSGMQNIRKPGFHLQFGVDADGRDRLKHVLHSLGLECLSSIPVVHCPEAFGVLLQSRGKKCGGEQNLLGWKLVYSGDTRPCPQLVAAAQGATVLIHEATFDDTLLEEAISKNHSLTKEAIETGMAADAYRIILTHFSQRYPKIPKIDENCTHRTCVAFDLMSVNLADLPLLPEVSPLLKLLFKDEMADDELVPADDVVVNMH